MRTSGLTYCITGASSGLGEALVRELAKTPNTIFMAARSTDRMERIKKDLSSSPAILHTLFLDLEDSKSLGTAFADMSSLTDTIDVLIDNAGISQRGTAEETEMEVVRRITEVNYLGTVDWTSRCRPLLARAPGPRIIVISSVVGLFGFPLRSAYAASKHALQGYFESMQVETDSPVVTIVSPGRIRTPISEHALDAQGNAYGKMDKGQAAGLSPERAAIKIIKASENGRSQLYLGRKETILIYIRRFFPFLYRILAKRISAT